ncbi:flagellar protein [Campylobacter sp. MIT 12-5580]|uniref:DUF7494 domain-containing protein n=1 Tax=Campylobacter sp. MIT 12-5580 TaxID=2040651 RepID=UPI0010F59A3F|nr:flagellar protein [Campylobacter sp. MIT 12-5580]TKX28164.1 flagellar protein [Campylobacter sp. MIT 12-5580]
MRILCIFLLSFSALFSFEIVLNRGSDNNNPFGVLHLKNDENFTCKEFEEGDLKHYECEILGVVETRLDNQSFDFFDLNFTKTNQLTQIFIQAKIPSKMFNLSQKIYDENVVLSDNSDTNSTSFTFVFSDEIAYFKDHDGLDFDINFSNLQTPFVGALDLNSNPVLIPQSADINTFLRIKEEYEKQNYTQVITDASNAIERYQGSIFMNEFILYKLRAQNQLYTYTPDFRNQNQLEQMVEDAKEWSRTFTSDRNFPEISYIMMRAYMALEQRANMEYVVEILSNEYPENYFAQLALLDYADYLLNLGDRAKAQIIFNDLYYRTQNVDIAARAGLSLARLALIADDTNQALNLINTITNANANSFIQNKALSLELAKLLYDKNNPQISAMIYERVFNSLNRSDEEYEEVLKNLALALSKTNEYQKAKRYLDLYTDEFGDGEHLALVKEAADRIFFDLKDGNSSFLHEKYQSLMKEYANEIAAKALLYDVKLYFDENNTQAVLDYKDEIERYNNPEMKNLLERAAISRLNEDLRVDNCSEATSLFQAYKEYEIGQKINNKKAMLACLKRNLQVSLAEEYIDKNRQEDSIYYDLEKSELELNAKNYANTIALANGVIDSRTMKSDEERFNAYYFKFLAQLRQDDYNAAIKSLEALERFEMNFKMVELYHEFLLYCNEQNLTTSILHYAPKAIDFQNLKGVNVYSPELEFMYLDALNKSGNFSEALAVLTDLIKLNLDAEQRARAFYIQAEIFEKTQNLNAQRTSLTQCLDINTSSNWQNLCREKMNILNTN